MVAFARELYVQVVLNPTAEDQCWIVFKSNRNVKWKNHRRHYPHFCRPFLSRAFAAAWETTATGKFHSRVTDILVRCVYMQWWKERRHLPSSRQLLVSSLEGHPCRRSKQRPIEKTNPLEWFAPLWHTPCHLLLHNTFHSWNSFGGTDHDLDGQNEPMREQDFAWQTFWRRDRYSCNDPTFDETECYPNEKVLKMEKRILNTENQMEG